MNYRHEKQFKNIYILNSREDEKKQNNCLFPNCNGFGNINKNYKSHRVIQNCPQFKQILDKAKLFETSEEDKTSLKNEVNSLKR